MWRRIDILREKLAIKLAPWIIYQNVIDEEEYKKAMNDPQWEEFCKMADEYVAQLESQKQ